MRSRSSKRALKQRPDDPQLLNALGFTLADHKQRLPRAETAGPRGARGFAATTRHPGQPGLGAVQARQERDSALPVLARAWQNSGDGEIAAHYGEVLWKSGRAGARRATSGSRP